jgi:DNA invertase Pin-like site-specific DNA recombinase
VTRAALYLRVSTAEQDEENQAPDLHRIAAARGWEAVEYRETGTGSTDARPELARVMEAARRGEVAAVVVWSLSRLHRHMGSTVRDVQELDRLGVAVVSHRETWMDTGGPHRSLLVAIFGWLYEQERAELIVRTRAGLARVEREEATEAGRERRRAAGKRAVGRPRASSILLHGAADAVASGIAVRDAARVRGLSEATLRRFLRSRGLDGLEGVAGPPDDG